MARLTDRLSVCALHLVLFDLPKTIFVGVEYAAKRVPMSGLSLTSAILLVGIASLTGIAHSVALVGLVLAEALALYVGYGIVFRTAGEEVRSAIEDS